MPTSVPTILLGIFPKRFQIRERDLEPAKRFDAILQGLQLDAAAAVVFAKIDFKIELYSNSSPKHLECSLIGKDLPKRLLEGGSRRHFDSPKFSSETIPNLKQSGSI